MCALIYSTTMLCVCCAALSGSYTDVGYCLGDVCNALEEDRSSPRPAELMQLHDEFRKYESIHQEASQTNIELHQAMTQHIPNLRLLQGPRDELRKSLPQLQLSQGEGVCVCVSQMCITVYIIFCTLLYITYSQCPV